jgi:phosphatidylglycerophosphate synthase
VVTVLGSLLVSYTRAAGESLGIDFDGGLMQRAERMVAVSLAGIFDGALTRFLGWRPGAFLALVVALVAVGSVATAIYRTIWIGRKLRSRSI